jgi:hypothetical protein
MADVAADCLALRELVESYATAADRRDATGFADLFSVDATLATFSPAGAVASSYTGRDEIATIPQRLATYDLTVHLVGTVDVQVDGTTAAGEAGCTAHHLRGSDDKIMVIRYVDRYVREDRWRFSAREVRVLFTEHRAVER